MKKSALKAGILASALALASNASGATQSQPLKPLEPNRISLSANWSLPALSQEAKIMGKVKAVTGRVNTFRDAAEDGRMVIPMIKLGYNATRLIDHPALENTNFYISFAYTNGSIPTSYAIGDLETSKHFFKTGIGVEHFFLPRDSDINIGIEASLDYYYGTWGAKFQSPLVNLKYGGLDRGLGVYAGIIVAGRFPDELKEIMPILDRASWNTKIGYNQANIGAYGDHRGPIAGVELVYNFDEKPKPKKDKPKEYSWRR